MSGHSKWSKVKHKKAIEGVKKGKIFSKLARLITLAAREKGGDPEKNSDLKMAIEKAKSFNLPQENIERAIKKGIGEVEGAKLESLFLEAFGPGGISLLIEVVTDNKNRSLSEIRKTLEGFGGKIASGSVSWKFEKRGVITAESKEGSENVELLAIEAGAEDIKEKNGFVEIYIAPEKLNDVRKKFEEEKVLIKNATIDFIPKEEISVKEDVIKKAKELFESLDEREDVQEIYSDLKMQNY